MNKQICAVISLLALGNVVAAIANAAEADRTRAAEFEVAQAAPEAPASRTIHARPRIEVHPGRLLYRQCVDGYREVWRPYWGTTVVMPYMRCWWVRG